jgi:hypothetical protein
MLCRRDFLKGLIVLTPLAHLLGARSNTSSVLKVETDFGGRRNVSSTTSSLDRSRLLACIAAVESGNRDEKIGKRGERRKYQISEAVWYQHRTFPGRFEDWCHGRDAQIVAEKHIDLLAQLVHPTPFDVGYAWRTGAYRRRVEMGEGPMFDCRMSATRIANLYYSGHSTEQISSSRSV